MIRFLSLRIVLNLKSVFLGVLLLGLAGCLTSSPHLMEGPHAESPAIPSKPQEEKPSGSRLWAANCMRCHNARPRGSYSNEQWDIVLHHMRVRAYLTGQEESTILEFMKSAK